MTPGGSEPTSGREARLLILVVVVSLAVLLLLARLRFPAADLASVTPAAGPLAGLAARATFDEISATMVGLLGRVSPSLIMIPLEPRSPAGAAAENAERETRPQPGQNGDVVAEPAEPPLTVGLRVRAGLALAYLPAGFQPAPSPSLASPVEIVADDVERHIVLVRTAPGDSSPALAATLLSVGGFSYFGVVQATGSGPTIHPVFIGRVDSIDDPQWPQPLIALPPGPQLPPGAVIFTIDGRLVGLSVEREGRVAVVPAAALNETVATLTAGGGGPP